jgi:hypothetical protein
VVSRVGWCSGEDDAGSAGPVVVLHDLRREAEAAVEDDGVVVGHRRDGLEADHALSPCRLGERLVQTAPQAGATGVVAGRLCDQTRGAELPYDDRLVQRTQVALNQ